MAGIFSYGTTVTLSAFVDQDGVIHHDIEINDGGETDISFSSWSEVQKEAEGLGVPASMWPDYRTAIDLPVDDVTAKNKALREMVKRLGIASGGRGTWLDDVVDLFNKGYYILFIRDY